MRIKKIKKNIFVVYEDDTLKKITDKEQQNDWINLRQIEWCCQLLWA